MIFWSAYLEIFSFKTKAMKKIFFLLLSSITCLFAFTLLGHSQTSKKEFAGNYYSVLIKKEKQFTYALLDERIPTTK